MCVFRCLQNIVHMMKKNKVKKKILEKISLSAKKEIGMAANFLFSQ